MTNNYLFPILLTIVIVLIVFVPLIFKRIERNKEQAILDEQDKKLEEMTAKQNESETYNDFTDGHLYQ